METAVLWIDHEESDLHFDFLALCFHQLDPETGSLLLAFKGGFSYEIEDKVLAKDLSDCIKTIRAKITAQQNSLIAKP